MKPLSKAVLLLTVAAALIVSVSHVFARGGGGHPSQVKTSGTSTTPSGSGNGGNQSQKTACRYHHCITVPRQGITPGGGGGGPSRGGVDNPALHPK
jgi:hypothetical protein